MPGSPLRRAIASTLGAALAVAAAGAAPAAAASKPSSKVPKTATASDGARVTAQKWLTSHEVDLTVKSVALGQTVKVRILVPKGWKTSTTKKYPVLYALHGGRDHYLSWTRSTDIETYAYRYNVMVVMPEGGVNGSYTNWYNYGKYGSPQWEAFHNFEVREIVERAYHAGTSRAVMGNSSGGQGAITYAERYPGLYRYAASFSGLLSIRSVGIPALLMFTVVGAGDGTDPFRIWGVPGADDVNWRQHDPLYLIQRLKGTGVYISAGTTGKPGPGDNPKTAPWDIGLLSERVVGATDVTFLQKAQQLGIPITSHIYGNGRHAWPAWIREMHNAWPKLMAAIGAKRV
ncbi:alpha/beta hydrolase family protein [Actinoallomurus acanthiterrae]